MIDAEMYYQHCTFEYKPMLRPLESKGDSSGEERSLSDEELMLCSRVVRGFSFKTKQWSMNDEQVFYKS